MTEIYISTDIEADGPIPGEYSMLSFGSVALDSLGNSLGKFYKKIKPLQNAKQHPKTMEFWKKNQEAYKEATANQEDPEKAMPEYLRWLRDIKVRYNKELVFVGYPATFDFMFIYWYLIKFTGESPFSFSALDIKSYASAVIKKDFKQTNKKSMPKHWFPKEIKHNHTALDDALEQGLLFTNILKENKK